MPNIVDSYLQYVADGVRKYGEKTMVFLECGAFYEIYDVVPVDASPHLLCCQERLGLLVTRKNKSDPKSAFMAGIPSHSIRRFNKTLLRHNYTIIFVTQNGEAPNITRNISKVLSPGCNLSEEVHENTDTGQSVLLSLLIEEDQENECYAHIATFDANCGKTRLQTIDCDTEYATSETVFTSLHDLLHTCLFHEMCVHYKSPHNSFSTKIAQFTRFWKDRGKQIHEFDVSAHQMDYMFKRSFQQQFLERVFKRHRSAYCTIWEALHLQYTEPSCISVLVMLLHWIQIHDSRLIDSLQAPQSYQASVIHRNDTSSTQLSHPTVHPFNELYSKLNIFHDNTPSLSDISRETRSVFALLNKTRTKMGERLLQDRFRHVATDKQTIEARYDLVDALLDRETHTTPNDTHKYLTKTLKCIDLERVYRRFSVGNLQPLDLPRLLRSQQHVLHVLQHLSVLPSDSPLVQLLPEASVILEFEKYQTKMQTLFDDEKCENINMGNLSTTLFREGQFIAIDQAVANFDAQKNAMHILANMLMAKVPHMKLPKNTTQWINIKSNDKDGYWLDVTKTRFQQLSQALDAMTESDKKDFCQATNQFWTIEDLTFDTKNKTNVKISGGKMRNLSHIVNNAQQRLIQLVKDTYIILLRDLYTSYYTQTIQPVIECIAQLDVAFSTATVATTFGYTRPTLHQAEHASLQATALRHPLIERLLVQSGKQDPYVPNDVDLSPESCWLLYGVNSVGKSSLLKGIAIGVLMAQAGLFVAAKTFTLVPYHKIFARTGNDDNIHLAHSSFIKEIHEVKQIIDNADRKSLVIADELCASTELDSAIDIVGSLLKMLTERRSTYAFATHLFALQEQQYVQELLHPRGSLHNFHLRVRFEHEKLLFDRTLTEGLPSNRKYGVLVADKVIQNKAFTTLLEQVHNSSSPLCGAIQSPYSSLFVHSHSFTTPSTHSFSIASTTSDEHDQCSDYVHSSTPTTTYTRRIPTSRYNRKHWNEECAVCHYRPFGIRHLPLDTHHITEQKHANKKNGLIDYRFHKNQKNNLVTLCKQCHQKIDTEELVVEGYVSTSNGAELVWYKNNPFIA